jgi:hypothetical protein
MFLPQAGYGQRPLLWFAWKSLGFLQLAGALHLHFIGKLPALQSRRSAWPVRPLGLQVAEILAEA